ncbi:MAG: ATP-binding protein [Oscillospiraceae bacterium]|nr:ATP-binding protein [Oscillospiraceae bacterium]
MYSSKVCDAALRQLSRRRSRALDIADQRREELFARVPRLQEIEKLLSMQGAQLGRMALSGQSFAQQLEEMRSQNLALQKEQDSILAQLGLPCNYLEPPYSCPHCQDTGNVDGKRCECLTALMRNEACKALPAPNHLDEYSFETFDLSFYPTQGNGSVSPRQQMQAVLNKCRSFAESFPCNGESLLFIGRTGLGKTHLSLAIANEVSKTGAAVAYASAQDLVDRAERARFGRDTGEDAEFVQGALTCDLLILDDLGTEFMSQMTATTLFQIINTRLLERRSTIISSNLSLEQMQERYSERLSSRILCSYSALTFTGNDIRLQKALM